MNFAQEFDHQVETLISKDYPTLAGLTKQQFVAQLNTLKPRISDLDLPDIDLQQGILPFVIVVKHQLVSTNLAMPLVKKADKPGVIKLYPLQPNDFDTIASITLPVQNIYLLIDIDRGSQSLNLPPSTAMQAITNANRSPLTIDEGVAIITHYPDYLIKNNCFSLHASRHANDLRVPAIWINGNKNPNLGWCWNGNPHTWLGSASCSYRIA